MLWSPFSTSAYSSDGYSYDPGPCNTETHGKDVLVKNTLNEDEEIVICVKDKDVFHWRSADSTRNTAGEFFNAGYDCSPLLNKRPNRKDGGQAKNVM